MRLIGLTRADRGPIADWWWTVDRWTLAAILALMMLGGLLGLAASPAVASRLDLPAFHFVVRQMVFYLPAICVLVGLSMLPAHQVRRLAVLIFAGAFLMMLGTLLFGAEIKGARRWLDLGPISVQPSEFVKPAFTVVIAWLLASRAKIGGLAGMGAALGLYGAVVMVLALQPDFGQIMLLTLVFGGLLFVAGLSWFWIALMGAGSLFGAVMAYQVMPHVATRINNFIDPESGDTYQIDKALEAFGMGGLFGRGPGEGVVKSVLPDAHTDFIFAVAAEEFGVLSGLLIIALFGFIVVRSMTRALESSDSFVQFASFGLCALFALQTFINLAVNVNLMPSKGMTLPFISYGGSSLIALAITMGLLLALTRRRAGQSVPVYRPRESFA